MEDFSSFAFPFFSSSSSSCICFDLVLSWPVYSRSTMGACTSTEERQLHKRANRQQSLVLDNKHLSPIPLTIVRNQRPHSLSTNLDFQSSPNEQPVFDQTNNNNSLIQLYSLKPENNHHQQQMSSSSNGPPRIPVSKSRLPTHQLRPSITRSLRPKHPSSTTTLGITSPTGSN